MSKPTHTEVADGDDEYGPDDPPSKSQLKRESTALQDLGEALVALPADRLKRLDLPDNLRIAVNEARRITAHGALRRQYQYIGKVMRNIDPAPIRAQLEVFAGKSREHKAWLHGLERWRDRLLADGNALGELVAEHPDVDIQQIRTLIRNALREREQSKPPRAFRELFRILRELRPEPSLELDGPDDEAGDADDEHDDEDDNP
jgi:ribosome-associated protein